MVHSLRVGGLVFPGSTGVESPPWSIHPHEFLYISKVEVDRGDMRQVSEVGGGFWEAVLKRGALIAEAEPQNQQCPSGDMKVIQDDGMWRLCNNGKGI